jgi:hypothetical protein
MPMKLSTTLKSIATIPNPINATLLGEFYQHMKSNGTSESYQNGNLKVLVYFARFLGADTGFYSVNKGTNPCLFEHQNKRSFSRSRENMD